MTQRLTGRAQQQQAVLYARVSSKDQEKEGFSIPAQLKLLRDYAEARSLSVVREFVDVETAKQTGRTGFGEMLDFLGETPTCRELLVEKTDRLYRNFKDWVTLDELDLQIHFAKENIVLSRDSRSSEKFVHGIKVLMAKNYIDNLSEETRKGMLEKAEQGIWPSFAPLGYRNVLGPNGKKAIEPDPDLAPIVIRLFERYATGRHSLAEVTRVARAEGMIFRKSKDPVPKATVHKILRNPIYAGEFDWNGRRYRGIHAPLVSRDLWGRVQAALDHRFSKRHRKVRHDFAFSGLISCGHCGCSLVGEIKKSRYVYYHCTGYRGKCPERYTREEVLADRFTDLLRGLALDDEVVGWVTDALRQSHSDEKQFHEEAIGRLQAEYTRLQSRIDAMYIDKLDRRVDAGFFDRMAGEWRAEQDRVLRAIEEHQTANRTYLDQGVQLLELARRAPALFERQEPREKRRLLNFVLSNCTWRDGALQVTFRQPFDLIAGSAAAHETRKAAGVAPDGLSEIWLPGQDSNLQPRGYKGPRVSTGLGLSHPLRRPIGARRGRALPPELRRLSPGYDLAV
jgi:site-specific DNA recombinase